MKNILFVITYIMVFLEANAQTLSMVYDAKGDFNAKATYVEVVNQVSLLREQVEEAKKTLDVSKQMNDSIAYIRTEAGMLYNNTFGIIGEVGKLVESIQSIPKAMEKTMLAFKKNADCLFNDFTTYQKSETLYKSLYVFKQPQKNEKDENGQEDDTKKLYDPYVFKDGSDHAGTYDALHLVENPCGHQMTTYEQLAQRLNFEKEVIVDVLSATNKSEADLKLVQEKFAKLEDAVSKTKSEKDGIHTMKYELLEIIKILSKIEKRMNQQVFKMYAMKHDPSILRNVPNPTEEQLEELTTRNSDPGNRSEALKAMMEERKYMEKRIKLPAMR